MVEAQDEAVLNDNDIGLAAVVTSKAIHDAEPGFKEEDTTEGVPPKSDESQQQESSSPVVVAAATAAPAPAAGAVVTTPTRPTSLNLGQLPKASKS